MRNLLCETKIIENLLQVLSLFGTEDKYQHLNLRDQIHFQLNQTMKGDNQHDKNDEDNLQVRDIELTYFAHNKVLFALYLKNIFAKLANIYFGNI